MNISAVIAQVTTRKATRANGTPVTYYSAFALDAEPNPLLRFPGQIQFNPTEEDIKERNICEGAAFKLHIMQILELRNGIPVCQVKLETPPQTTEAATAKPASK